MSIPYNLLKVFKDYDKYPILENVKSGDYIDDIEHTTMCSSIMKGIDYYNRFFIAIKIFPRTIYYKLLNNQYKTHETCLTLVALSRNNYLPVEISRYIQEFIDFRPISDKFYEQNNKHKISLDLRKQYLEHQISVHTIFQRYTRNTNQTSGVIVRASNPSYNNFFRIFNMETIILFGHGEWNKSNYFDEILDRADYINPESELTNLMNNKHPNAMIYNNEIENLIAGKYPPRPLISQK